MSKHPIVTILCTVLILGILPACHAVCDRSTDSRGAEEKTRMLHNIAHFAQTSDQETQQKISQITSALILAAPNEHGAKVYEKGLSKNAILFIPIFANDTYGETWRDMLQDNVSYVFIPSLRAVAIKTQNAYSPAGSVIAFLRYAYHGIYVHNEAQTDIDYFAEKMEAYAFQGKIMEAIGKEKYHMLIQKELGYIRNNVQDGGIIPWPKNIDVDFAFGKTVSQEEKDFLQKSVWINASFAFFEQSYPSSVAWRKKVMFLDYLEEHGWQL